MESVLTSSAAYFEDKKSLLLGSWGWLSAGTLRGTSRVGSPGALLLWPCGPQQSLAGSGAAWGKERPCIRWIWGLSIPDLQVL